MLEDSRNSAPKKQSIVNSQQSLKPVTHDKCPVTFSLIDTHCHLEMDEFNPDRDMVIRRAQDAGIQAIITIGSDLGSNIKGLELSKKYDFIYSSIGIHPHDAKDFTDEILRQLRKWIDEFRIKNYNQKIRNPQSAIRNPKIVAIGETGLDYHYDNSPREVQTAVFRKHLELSRETGLPVIIHSREAKKDTLEILKESGANKGVFHCFSGDIDMAEEGMKMGFFISFAGPVTFKNAQRLREIAKTIPDEFLLIETDAPYLTPEPFRGKRNEPSYIIHTAKLLAELRGITLEDLSRITTVNAKRLFGIGQMPEKGEIAYKIRNTLYLNLTNRCSNECIFCVRFHTDYVKGHNLRLSDEPTEEELKSAIKDPSVYKEVVFCGYGEPLLRLDVVKHVASWIKKKKGRVRINTNGHANLIHGRNILPELHGLVDSISISLDAHDEETYNKICRPSFTDAFQGVISFIKEARKYIPEVRVTVVTVKDVDIEKARKLAEDLGVEFRVRKLDVVG
jgi:TatD DNase family protein